MGLRPSRRAAYVFVMRARWDFQRVLGSVVFWTCVAKKVMKKLQKLRKNGVQELQIEAQTAKIDEKSFLRARGVEKGGFFTPKCGPGWFHKRQRATAGGPRSAQRDPKGYPRGSQRHPRGPRAPRRLQRPLRANNIAMPLS